MEPRVSCAHCGRALAPGAGYLEVGEGAGARAYHIECCQAAPGGPPVRVPRHPCQPRRLER